MSSSGETTEHEERNAYEEQQKQIQEYLTKIACGKNSEDTEDAGNGDSRFLGQFYQKYCSDLGAAEATISSQAIGLGVGTPVAMAGGAGASFAAPLVARFLKGLLSK